MQFSLFQILDEYNHLNPAGETVITFENIVPLCSMLNTEYDDVACCESFFNTIRISVPIPAESTEQNLYSTVNSVGTRTELFFTMWLVLDRGYLQQSGSLKKVLL